uniref:Lysosomal dipeptide transporter MFSD1 n=1 Tax=Eptatretus burgeri TaxID=7764 RepID=A0A8C4R5R2_EPTBU
MAHQKDQDLLIQQPGVDTENDANVDSEAEQLTGCGASALCDPRRKPHRFLVLILMCLLSFGSYFCYDIPAALQTQIMQDMKVNSVKFMQLYAWYSWPNVILCFLGGFLIDRVFGIRLGTIIFSCFVVVGQVLFSFGAFVNRYWLMEVARFVFGIGGESLAVAQNTYAVLWFKGRELNLVFGLQLSMARLGSTVNMNIMGPVYEAVGRFFGVEGYRRLGISFFIGGVTCLFSLACGLILGYLDKRAERILHRKSDDTVKVIKLSDVRYFPLTLWMVFMVCVFYYVAVFPFIGLGKVFFEEKFDFPPAHASAVNSIVYILSAPLAPIFGFIVDIVGKNVMWVLLSVGTTLGSHCLLAFTFLNPWVAMVIMGCSYSMLACSLWPIVAFVVESHQLGTAYGFMQSIQNLGLAVVSISSGAILDSSGYFMLELFFCACLCGTIAILTMYSKFSSSVCTSVPVTMSGQVRSVTCYRYHVNLY